MRIPIRPVAVVIAMTLLSAWPGVGQPLPDNPLVRARELALSGDRDAASELLTVHLQTHPDDTDARTLLGTVLSWQGDYDDARLQLQTVLATHATHGDALPALVNLELWSDHPARAESLARIGLASNPESTSLQITRVQALWQLAREGDALDAINQVLARDPKDETARRLRRALRETRRFWLADVRYSYDGFSDGRGSWQQTHYSLTRQTRIGSITGRLYRAERFGLVDHQLELDMYPKFRDGTYAYVSVASASDPILFPKYRLGFDVYQSFGLGFEASGGYRRMQFAEDVHIYVGSLTKYRGNWMYTSRVFMTPASAGSSTTVQGIARRYRPDGAGYLGLRYGRGAYRDEVRSLNDIASATSDTFAAEWVAPIGSLELWLAGGASREGRPNRAALWQFSMSSGLGVRF